MEKKDTQIEIIKNYENIINKNKYNMLQIIILYNMKCHENYIALKDNEKWQLLSIIYNIYIKDESFTDLAHFSDIVMNNYKIILEHYKNGGFNLIKTLIFEKV